MIAKLIATVLLSAAPLTAAYSRTVHFNCGLGHGGIAVFQIAHQAKIDGVARYRKPSGQVLVEHLKSAPCVSPAGCLVIARAEGVKGYKLIYIVEKSSSEFTLVAKKCR